MSSAIRGGETDRATAQSRISAATSEPESRRRLQGTLLTCAIYKRDEEPPGKATAVLLTADSSGDPKGVLRTEENLLANCEHLFRALEVSPEDRILTKRLREAGGPVLLDTQWRTEHLATLGVVDMPRRRYLRALSGVLDGPTVL